MRTLLIASSLINIGLTAHGGFKELVEPLKLSKAAMLVLTLMRKNQAMKQTPGAQGRQNLKKWKANAECPSQHQSQGKTGGQGANTVRGLPAHCAEDKIE